MDAIAKCAVVVRGNIVAAARADVVQGIVRQQCDGPALRRLPGHDRDVRVSRSGRLDQIRTFDRRIHFHEIICAAKRVDWNGPGLHVPAPVENLVRLPAHAPADFRRSKIVHGALDTVGNARCEKFCVIRVRVALENADAGRPGVRVCGRNEYMVGGNAGSLPDQFLGRVHHRARDHATIADHDGEARLAIIEHEAARVQLVVNVRGDPVVEVAIDGHAQSRRDVARGGTGAEWAQCRGGLRLLIWCRGERKHGNKSNEQTKGG